MIHIETCFNYCSPEQGFFSSDERKWITRIRKLKAKYPDLVEIIREPEQNNGCIYAKMPPRFLKLQGDYTGSKRELTEEQREVLRNRLALARSKRHTD